LSNYKALGIEKDMQIEFSNYDNLSELQALMNSCYFEKPYITERKKEAHYCTVEVTDCKHDDWWYSKLIGLKFFCRIKFERYNDSSTNITEFVGVKLTKNKEIIFRHFDPADVIII
jgi:hypothetical protein